MQSHHRDLDTDDRLRGEARDRRRTVVIDADCESSQSDRDSLTLSSEPPWPSGVVRNDFDRFIHLLALPHRLPKRGVDWLRILHRAKKIWRTMVRRFQVASGHRGFWERARGLMMAYGRGESALSCSQQRLRGCLAPKAHTNQLPTESGRAASVSRAPCRAVSIWLDSGQNAIRDRPGPGRRASAEGLASTLAC